MITLLRARVEDGRLRPLQDLPLAEGQEVELLLYSPEQEVSPRMQAWLEFLRDTEPLSEEQLQMLEQAVRRLPLFGLEKPASWTLPEWLVLRHYTLSDLSPAPLLRGEECLPP